MVSPPASTPSAEAIALALKAQIGLCGPGHLPKEGYIRCRRVFKEGLADAVAASVAGAVMRVTSQLSCDERFEEVLSI